MRHGKYHIYIAQHRGGETQAQRDKIQGPRERQRESETERQRVGREGGDSTEGGRGPRHCC